MTTTPKTDASRPARPATAYGPVQPICWPALSLEDEALALDQLATWVDWVKWRYTLDHRVIPDCWRQHGPIVEELSALYTAWQTAYVTSAAGDAPLLWLEHFAVARARLTDWTARTGCRPREHRVDSRQIHGREAPR